MKAQELALCGLLTAAAEVLLLLGGVIPLATFCAPMLAMLVLLPILEESGPKAALTAYAACALLALLLVPDRELAFVYLAFGWYPVLRPRIAALRKRWLRFLCRILVCTGIITLLYGVLLAVLGLGEVADVPGSSLLTGVLLLCGNVTFLMLDLVLERFSLLWRRRLRGRLLRRF